MAKEGDGELVVRNGGSMGSHGIEEAYRGASRAL